MIGMESDKRGNDGGYVGVTGETKKKKNLVSRKPEVLETLPTKETNVLRRVTVEKFIE